MFDFRVHQEVTCVAEGNGYFYAKAGSMVAYKGNFTADKVMFDTNRNQSMLRSVVNMASRKLTGENIRIMKVSGNGQYFIANRAQHVSIITLQCGQRIGVESENLLAFTQDCNYGVRFLGSGVISQKGMFTTNLKAEGHDAKVIITTNGNPIILETPCVVDPDAVVCWTGQDPNFKVDMSWKTFIGQQSGESYAMEFNYPGEIVIVQPSERISEGGSHINLAID